MKKLISYFSFHKEGIKMLRFMHGLDKSIIPVSLISALLNSVSPFVAFILSAGVIDSIIAADYTMTLYYIIGLVASTALLGVIIDSLNNIYDSKSTKIQYMVEIMIRKHALGLDYEIMEDPNVLEMVSGAEFSMQHSGGFGKMLSLYRKILENVLKITYSVILVLDLCCRIGNSDGVLKLISSVPVSIIFVILIVAVNIVINLKLVKELNDKNLDLFDRHMKFEKQFVYMMRNVIQNIPLGKTIRLYNMQNTINDYCTKRNNDLIKGIFGEIINMEKKQSFTISFLSGITVLFAYMLAVLKVVVGAITIGSLTKYIGAISELTSSATDIFSNNDRIRTMCSFMKKFNDFLEIKNIRNTGTIPVEKRDDNEYEIEFHNVSFKYPNTEDMILDNVSCKLKLKKKMAIVGRNGAGKSTFIKLMCRLYDPTEGYITLNGVDIKKYNYDEYITLFGVVFQDFNLFACPLEQNVSASVNPDEAKVWDALEQSGVKDRVERMPLGLKTPLFKLDEGGIELSGGEAQKVAIARALYKDAPFVILDEPTAALDPISEYDIYKRFDELVYDKTSIYISHRMSSCRFCDNIMVFDKGKIVQWGSHDELVSDNNGLYAQLWNAQAKYYEQTEKETA